MIELQCPLEPTTFLKSLHSTGLRILEEIERHISTSNLCHHPPLNEVVLIGSLDGTTPLLLACHFGDLNWVKHIVENWRVDIQAAGVYYTKCLPDRWSFDRATPLFVATFNLHIDIVKYLVGLGACSVYVIMATMHKSCCQVNTVHLTAVYLRPPIRDVICQPINSTVLVYYK